MKRIWHKDRFIPWADGVRVECGICQRPMWLPESKAALYKTCGRECSRELLKSRLRERIRNCETCGKEFFPRNSQLSKGQGRFCSVSCNTAGVAALISPESLEKGRKTRRANFAAGLLTFPKGPDHHRWRGGAKAVVARRIAAGHYREANHRRRLKTGEKIDPKLILAMVEKQKWRCAACGCSVRRGYEMDHVMPLALGGAHSIQNIQILCRRCNRSKQAMHPLEFAKKHGRLF